MAKWKELGEVPDSDDESDFDSQESSQELPVANPKLNDNDRRDHTADGHDGSEPSKLHNPVWNVDQARDEDIWDIPSSPQPEPIPDPVNDVPASSSSLEPPPDSTPPGLRPTPPPPQPPSDFVVALDYDLTLDRESYERVTEREEGPAPAITPGTADPLASPALAVVDVPDDAGASTQRLIQYNRSLRPRKPIQEHPYLLESAQYTKMFKSHGVKPVRVQIEEAARRRQEEEDSQEQDYEEDSQSTAKGANLEESGESQVLDQSDPFGDIDELAPSPARRVPSPSPLRPRPGEEDLIRSSQDDEEFPDPADIAKWKRLRLSKNTTKRPASPKMSAKTKIPKRREPKTSANTGSPLRHPVDVFDIPPSPPQTSPALFSITPKLKTARPRSVTALSPKPSSVISSRNPSPAPANRTSRIIDLTMPDEQDSDVDGNGGDPTGASEDETDVLLRHQRRIRGVLPASWLRIDQQGPRPTPKPVRQRRSIDRSPERSVRKGVAQRRQVSPKPTTDTPFFFDDSDEHEIITNSRLDETNDFTEDSPLPVFDDDAGSVIEENSIDWMLPGNKRTNHEPDGHERPKKKRKQQQSTFKGHLGQRRQQQRITGHLNRTKSTASTSHSKKRSYAAPRTLHEHVSHSARTPTPPRLSILDVAEPDAPLFIRTAMRAARRRSDKGRTSPTQKQISLSTRNDHLEATEVLRLWRKGKIQPKPSIEDTSTKQPADEATPLRPVSHNAAAIPRPRPRPGKPRVRRVIPSSRFSRSRGPAKQASMDSFVSVEVDMVPEPVESTNTSRIAPKQAAPSRRRNVQSASRPAQLEAAGESIGRYAFSTRKKALDAMYRKSRMTLPAPANIRLDRVFEKGAPTSNDADTQSSDDMLFMDIAQAVDPLMEHVAEPAPRRKKLQSRKQRKPRHLDTTAPQYAQANDPLPREASPIAEVPDVSEAETRLLGLGPFGTHYTRHFEVFPLDPGVFFHESTLLGSGRLAKALEGSLDGLCYTRGRSVFVLDEKNLQWGSWDAQTSSEFGIVCDWIADRLGSDTPLEDSPRSAAQAALFVLEYLQDSLSFPDQASHKTFAHRTLEVFQSYLERLEALPNHSGRPSKPLMHALGCGLLAIYQILRICRKLDMPAESFQFEELLRKTAKHTSKRLLEIDLNDIRSLYGSLQQRSYRERGIRDDQFSAVSWVVLMRVLEGARIPRSGFWDIVSPTMLRGNAGSIVDAHAFDRAWHNLFTLLPLGEFNMTGVLVPGIRHTAPLEGWWLPQQLLSRLFQLYKGNSRQSPSFNDYCRGAVGRCHYLVEHWGWRKCNGVIGTIFDFFASQDLSHLRNEEAYRSPQFLEDLASSPSLAILPEDRCFHIFLKLLALAIKRLRKARLFKDVRNLIARVLPNHDRNYVKEQEMRETELAALRNHHDLLCTLFWSAPPDLRPSIQLIEKLVVPGSSHKEACLVNLRAWNQLARFIVSSGEDISVYKPFAEWQRNVFQQVLDQYLSAESDVQQQFLRLSKDASRNISQDFMKSVVKANKKASMDVLHFSMKAVLDVMRHTPTLAATSFVLSHSQVDQIFTRCLSASAEYDWGSLRVAVDTLDYYIRRIEEFLVQQGGRPGTDDSWHGEDAILLLERKITAPFLSMVRAVIRTDFAQSSRGSAMDRIVCLEEAVSVAGRIGARLIHTRLARVSKFFSHGNFCVFEGLPKSITAPSRKFIPLFLATLLDKEVIDFKDLGATNLELFLGAITKPFQYLAYENRLAESMKRRGDPYLADAFVDIGKRPDYNSNRDLFSHTISRMRRSLRFAEPNQRQQLQAEFVKALKSAMEQIKQDLKLMVPSPPEHADYINFVRRIVALIREQDICPVDSYFYQISPEYSPSRQDPRLQTAGILACGLKLEEGNAHAAYGLFYLLWPNFTTALANGKLADERSILEQGMRHPHVFLFMLSTMLPAVIQTSVRKPEGWVLLETYVGVLESWMTGPAVHKEIGEESMDSVLVLLRSAEAGLRHLQGTDACDLRPEHVYTLAQLFRLLNLLAPSLDAFLINESGSLNAEAITKCATSLTGFARAVESYASGLLDGASGELFAVGPARLFESLPRPGDHSDADPVSGPDNESLINGFSAHMNREIDHSWVTVSADANGGGELLTVKGPAPAPVRGGQQGQQASATQQQALGLGTVVPRWDLRALIAQLREQASEWNEVFSCGPSDEFDEAIGLEEEYHWERSKRRGAWESRWTEVIDLPF